MLLQSQFKTFSIGQPGHDYVIQYSTFFNAIDSVKVGLEYGKKLEDVVPIGFSKAQAAIDAIPVPTTSVILEAGTPFTAYCRLRELCEIDATSSLIWLDPYIGASIFIRYIANTRPSIPVTIVTSEPSSHAGGRDRARWSDFLDTSRLFATERGPNLYTLIIQPSLHDRWVVFDNKRIYALGGSAKDAATKDDFTITSIQSTLPNLEKINGHLSSGVEFFGINTPTHI